MVDRWAVVKRAVLAGVLIAGVLAAPARAAATDPIAHDPTMIKQGRGTTTSSPATPGPAPTCR